MKEMILKWSECYVETFLKTRFPSQLFAFCVALVLLFGVTESVFQIVLMRHASSPALLASVRKELSVHLFLAALFGVRFFLLFYRKKKHFWLAQFVWFFIYLTLLSQITFSVPGCTKNMFPMFGENFAYIFVAYLFLSPVRQFVTLLASFSRIPER